MGIISISPLTLWEADALEMVSASVEAGFAHAGLRIVPPPNAPMRPVMSDAAFQREIKQRVRDTDLGVLEVEAFWLSPDFDCDALMPAFELGAELKARNVLVVGNDPDRSRTVDNFSTVCGACKSLGLTVVLEFMPFSQVTSLADAIAVLDAAGQDNAGLLIDALHLSRAKVGPADVAGLLPSRIHYLHICDAPAAMPTDVADLRQEARTGRLYPGEGELQLLDFLNAAPADIAVGIEAPNHRNAHLPLVERARRALRATMDVMAGAKAARSPRR